MSIYLGLCTAHTEPGHRVVQAIFWTLWPSQKAPPLRGAGLVQVLVRFWKPLPHRLLHTDHSVQVDHPPFTERQERKSMIMSANHPVQPKGASGSFTDVPIIYARWEIPLLWLEIDNALSLPFQKVISGCQGNFTHLSVDIAGEYEWPSTSITDI